MVVAIQTYTEDQKTQPTAYCATWINLHTSWRNFFFKKKEHHVKGYLMISKPFF